VKSDNGLCQWKTPKCKNPHVERVGDCWYCFQHARQVEHNRDLAIAGFFWREAQAKELAGNLVVMKKKKAS
jgi:hypothetical protein